MSLYSQNISNNPLSLDGLITGNFDELYLDGVPIVAVNTALLVPYTGATGNIDINSRKITTTYVPVNNPDLTNKLFTDSSYLSASGFNVNTGTFNFQFGSTLNIPGFSTYVNNLQSGTVVSLLAIDSSNKLISANAVGDALLAGGTALSYQYFSGYNQFGNNVKTDTITNNTLITTGTLRVTGVLAGSGTLLAVNGSGDIVSTTSSVTQTVSSTNATYYIPFVATAGTTSFIPFVFSNITFNPSTGALGVNSITCQALTLTSIAIASPSYFLGLDSGGIVIKITAPTQLDVISSSTNASYYPTFIDNNTSGVRTIYSMAGVSYNPSTTVFTVPILKIASVPIGTQVGLLAYDAGGNIIVGTSSGGGDAYLANTQTFSGVNTFSNQMTLSSGFELTLGVSSTFNIRNSSSVLQFQVVNTGVLMKDLVLSGTILNMSNTGSNIFYSGGDLLFQGPTNVSKTITHTVAGSYLELSSSGLVLVGTKKIFCDTFSTSTGSSITIEGTTDSYLNINGASTSWLFQTGSPTLVTRCQIGYLGLAVNTIYPISGTSIEFKQASAGTTVFGYDTTGLYVDNIRNRAGVNLVINGNGSGSIDLQYMGVSRLLTNSSGVILTGGSLDFMGTPYINATVAGYNWYIAGTQIGYFDTDSSTGWRISASNNLTLSSSNQVYIQGLPTGNPCVNVITNSNFTGQNAYAAGWNTNGGAFVVTNTKLLNNTAAIGIGYSTTGGFGNVSCVEPNVQWRGIHFETGNANWYYNGSLVTYLNGAGWNNISDVRCKKDIQSLSTKKSLQRILQCRTTFYHRTIEEDNKDSAIPVLQEDIDRVHIGLIAQEVNEFNPHCVSEWEVESRLHDTEVERGFAPVRRSGTEVESRLHDTELKTVKKRLGIQYSDFVIHLIGGVQEQQKQINEQNAIIENQHKSIDVLFDHVKRLTEQVNQLTRTLFTKSGE